MSFDVVAVGSAIVDLLVPVASEVVRSAGLEPGTMTLVDEAEAGRLWSHLLPGGDQKVVAGGSAANTAVGVAALGGRSALVGQVGGDALGAAYAEDLRRMGVDFELPSGGIGRPGATGRCYIIVTPDGERTMRTYLGAAPEIDPASVDAALAGGTRFAYLEGYLWDAPGAVAGLERALKVAPEVGAQMALSLSDPGCVERNGERFRSLITAGAIDVLFANESEIAGLWPDAGAGLEAALDATRRHCRLAAVTRGPSGSVVVAGEETTTVAARPTKVVDTTGAGDLYAAGFLVGLSRGLGLERCAQLASLAAADIISAMGARPHGDIRAQAESEGLLG
jgi:sugar/nucleoside kinase (ribokinase family)